VRAVLKAYGVTDRRVLACDTFSDPPERRPGWTLVLQCLRALTYIPGRSFRRKLFRWIQSKARAKRFPAAVEPSDDLVDFSLSLPRNFEGFEGAAGGSLEHVKSYFARYGLLDDQVTFIRGFFSETLNDGKVGRIALLRIDADTYESTSDALTLLYPRLSPGGY